MIDDKKLILNPEDSYSVIFRELVRIVIIILRSLDNSVRLGIAVANFYSINDVYRGGDWKKAKAVVRDALIAYKIGNFCTIERKHSSTNTQTFRRFIVSFDGFPRNMISCDRGAPRGDECTKSRPGIRSRSAL